MLPGLQQGQEKMSKSDPSSSIFMEDEEVCFSFIWRKINNVKMPGNKSLLPATSLFFSMVVIGRSKCEDKEGILSPKHC